MGWSTCWAVGQRGTPGSAGETAAVTAAAAAAETCVWWYGSGRGGGMPQMASALQVEPEAAACSHCSCVVGLSDMYEVKHVLGSGSAGDTWLCR